MNIGILTPGFSRDTNDWALPFLQNLAVELAQSNAVRVLALRYPYTQQPYRIDNVQIHPLGYGATARGWQRLQLWTQALRTIARLHREKPFDVLHAIWADETGLLAAWAGKLFNIPSVTSIAGGELVCLPEIQYGSQCSRFGRWIVGQALSANVVTVSGSHVRGLLSKAGYPIPAKQIHTLVWGVHTETFTPPKFPPRKTRLIHVGSLVGIKNQAMLLRAVAHLENIELDIIGEGVLRLELEKLAHQLGIMDRVHFVGSIAYPDMPAYYQRATLHIITSHNEVVPMATLEAAACGVPTISTAVGVLPDHPTMGITVASNHVVLAEAIEMLLQDETRLGLLAQSAYETVQNQFSVQIVAQQLRTLYADLQL